MFAGVSNSLPLPYVPPNPRALDSTSAERLPHTDRDVLSDCSKALALGVCGGLAKLYLRIACTATVHNGDVLRDAVYHRNRPWDQEFDDPGVIMSAFNWSMLLTPRLARWTIAARDQIFTNAYDTAFFTALKVLPIVRGGGIEQPDVKYSIQRLDDGDWINVFPEGYISMTDGMPLLPIRLGVGRLVHESRSVMVLPVYTEGMNVTKPPDLPPVFDRDILIDIMVGQPIDFSAILEEFNESGNEDKRVVYAAVAKKVGEALAELREQLHDVHKHRLAALVAEREAAEGLSPGRDPIECMYEREGIDVVTHA